MVTARKSKSRPGGRETLEEKFQRIISEPDDAPFPKLTKREGRYFLKRIWETGDPKSPSGAEVMRDFYGDWSEDDDA